MLLVVRPARQEEKQAGGSTNQTELFISAMPLIPFVHIAFGTGPTFYLQPVAPIQGPNDMLSLPLEQHILDYEPPCGFVIPAFSMFNESTDPYDHMLNYN